LRITYRRRATLPYLIIAATFVPLLGWIDIITGYELSFSIFYLMPIAIAAWVGGTTPALVVSVTSAVTWGVADHLSGHEYSNQLFYVWNSIIRLGFFVIVSLLLGERQRAHAREAALARTDALTGLANSRHFGEVVETELSRCRRYQRPLSLAYIDLDNFKEVNDRSGHAAGDSLLTGMATALRQQLREGDTAARLGGDEFAVLLPEVDLEAARAAGRRVHHALNATAARAGHPVSASVGILTCRTPPRSRDELVQMADQLMYSVKRTSKNAVTCSLYDEGEAQ
jgi:diguanylate cyclase (GGDEF)-like protein